MNFPLYIAKRYLFAKSDSNAINIITFIASVGVVIGTAALFVILSAFSGLRAFNYSLLDTSDPDIKITPAKGKSFFFDESFSEILGNNPLIQDYSKVISERVLIKNGDKQQIAFVKGVDEHHTKVVPIENAIHMGIWLQKEYSNASVIGNGLAYKLSLGLASFNQPLEIIVPKAGTRFLDPLRSFRKISTQIIGVYFGTEQFENNYVFVANEQAQRLLNYAENQFTGIEIKLKSTVDSDDFSEHLQKKLGSQYKVQTKAQLNELFYKVMNTENVVSYLIFTLIVIIAMFTLVGSIIMMIIDKKNNLRTLLSLGATLSDVKKIFAFLGVLLTTLSMIVGLVLSVFVVFIQQQFHLFMITATLPYPVALRLSNLLIVIATISLLGVLATLVASSRISISFSEK